MNPFLRRSFIVSLEDRRFFDVAFATKWVLTQGDVVAKSEVERGL